MALSRRQIENMLSEITVLSTRSRANAKNPEHPSHAQLRAAQAEFKAQTGKDSLSVMIEFANEYKQELDKKNGYERRKETQENYRSFRIKEETGAPSTSGPRTAKQNKVDRPSTLYEEKRAQAYAKLSAERRKELEAQRNPIDARTGQIIKSGSLGYEDKKNLLRAPSQKDYFLPEKLDIIGKNVAPDPAFRVAYYGAARNSFANKVADNFKESQQFNAYVAKKAQDKFDRLTKEFNLALHEHYRKEISDPNAKVEKVQQEFARLSNGNAQNLHNFLRGNSNTLTAARGEPFPHSIQASLAEYAEQAFIRRNQQQLFGQDTGKYRGLRLVKEAFDNSAYRKRFGHFSTGGQVGGSNGFSINLGPNRAVNGVLSILHTGEVVLTRDQVKRMEEFSKRASSLRLFGPSVTVGTARISPKGFGIPTSVGTVPNQQPYSIPPLFTVQNLGGFRSPAAGLAPKIPYNPNPQYPAYGQGTRPLVPTGLAGRFNFPPDQSFSFIGPQFQRPVDTSRPGFKNNSGLITGNEVFLQRAFRDSKAPGYENLQGFEDVIKRVVGSGKNLSKDSEAAVKEALTRLGRTDHGDISTKIGALSELSKADPRNLVKDLAPKLQKEVATAWSEGIDVAFAKSIHNPRLKEVSQAFASKFHEVNDIEEKLRQAKAPKPLSQAISPDTIKHLEESLADAKEELNIRKQILEAETHASAGQTRDSYFSGFEPDAGGSGGGFGGGGGKKKTGGGSSGGGKGGSRGNGSSHPSNGPSRPQEDYSTPFHKNQSATADRGATFGLHEVAEPVSLFSTVVGDLFLLGEIGYSFGAVGSTISKVFIDANAKLEVFLVTLKSTLGTAEKANDVFNKFAQPFALEVPFFESKDLISTINKLAAEGFSQQSLTGNLDKKQGSKYEGSVVKSITQLAAAFGTSPDQATDAFISATQNRFTRLRQYGISREDLKNFGFSGSAEDSQGAVDALQKVIELRFSGTIEQLGKTFAGASSNVQDFFQTMVRLGTEKSFNAVTNFLVEAADGANTLSQAFGGASESTSAASKSFSRYLREDIGGIFEGVTNKSLEFLKFLGRFKAYIAAIFVTGIAPFIVARTGQFFGGLAANTAKIALSSAVGKVGVRALGIEGFSAKNFFGAYTAPGAVATGASLDELVRNKVATARISLSSLAGPTEASVGIFRNAETGRLVTSATRVAKPTAAFLNSPAPTLFKIGEALSGANKLKFVGAEAAVGITESVLKNFPNFFTKLQEGAGVVKQLTAEVVEFGSVAAGIFKFSLVQSIFEGIGAFDDLRRGIRNTGRVLKLQDLGETLKTTEKLTLSSLNNIGKVFGQSFGDTAADGPFLGLTNTLLTLGNVGLGAIEKLTKGFSELSEAITTPLKLAGDLIREFEKVGKENGAPGGAGSLVGVGAVVGAGALAAKALANPKIANAVISRNGLIGAGLLLAGTLGVIKTRNEYDQGAGYRVATSETARDIAGGRLIGLANQNGLVSRAELLGEIAVPTATAVGAYFANKGITALAASAANKVAPLIPPVLSGQPAALSAANKVAPLIPPVLSGQPAALSAEAQAIANAVKPVGFVGKVAGGAKALSGKFGGPASLLLGLASDISERYIEKAGEDAIQDPYQRQLARVTRKSASLPIGVLSNLAGFAGSFLGAPGGFLGSTAGYIIAQQATEKALRDFDTAFIPRVNDDELRKLLGPLDKGTFEKFKKQYQESTPSDLLATAKTPDDIRKVIIEEKKSLGFLKDQQDSSGRFISAKTSTESRESGPLKESREKFRQALSESLKIANDPLAPKEQRDKAIEQVKRYKAEIISLNKELNAGHESTLSAIAAEVSYNQNSTAQIVAKEKEILRLQSLIGEIPASEAVTKQVDDAIKGTKPFDDKLKKLEDGSSRDELEISRVNNQILKASITGGPNAANGLRLKKKELEKKQNANNLDRIAGYVDAEADYQGKILNFTDQQNNLQADLEDKSKAAEKNASGQFLRFFQTGGPDDQESIRAAISTFYNATTGDARKRALADIEKQVDKVSIQSSVTVTAAEREKLGLPGRGGKVDKEQLKTRFFSDLLGGAIPADQVRANLLKVGEGLDVLRNKAKQAGTNIANTGEKIKDDARRNLAAIESELGQQEISPLAAVGRIDSVISDLERNPLLGPDDDQTKQAKQRRKAVAELADNSLRGRTEQARELNTILSDSLKLIKDVTQAQAELDSLDSTEALSGSLQQVRALSGLVDSALPGTDQYNQLLNEFNSAVVRSTQSYEKLLELRRQDIQLLRDITNAQQDTTIALREYDQIEALSAKIPEDLSTRANRRQADEIFQQIEQQKEANRIERETREYNRRQEEIANRKADRADEFQKKAAFRSSIGNNFAAAASLDSFTIDDQASLNAQDAKDTIESGVLAQERLIRLQEEEQQSKRKVLELEKQKVGLLIQQRDITRQIVDRDLGRVKSNNDLFSAIYSARTGQQIKEGSPTARALQIRTLNAQARGIAQLIQSGAKRDVLEPEITSFASSIGAFKSAQNVNEAEKPAIDRLTKLADIFFKKNSSASYSNLLEIDQSKTANDKADIEKEIGFEIQKQQGLATNKVLTRDQLAKIKQLYPDLYSKSQEIVAARDPEKYNDVLSAGLTSDDKLLKAGDLFRKAVDKFADAVGYRDKDAIKNVIGERSAIAGFTPKEAVLGNRQGSLVIGKRSLAAPTNANINLGVLSNNLQGIHQVVPQMLANATSNLVGLDRLSKSTATTQDTKAQHQEKMALLVQLVKQAKELGTVQQRKNPVRSPDTIAQQLGAVIERLDQLIGVIAGGDAGAQEGVFAGIKRTRPAKGYSRQKPFHGSLQELIDYNIP